jgi:hypothetical protein
VGFRSENVAYFQGTGTRGHGTRLALLTGLLLAVLAPSAIAQPYLPPTGKIYAGVTGDPTAYQQETGVHAAVLQDFVTWGNNVDWAVKQAQNNRSRLMLALKLANSGPNALSPAQIAAGDGDVWLKSLGNALFWRAQPTYLRLFAEMDNYRNSYCAFNANGSSRGSAYSPATFRNAWKRIVLILRGGVVSAINQQLHALGMPPVKSRYATLPIAPVAFLWVPMTFGDPNVTANQPSDYFPGNAWVDWVGTDFYSKFPNWSPLDKFYSSFAGRPFAFGEWGIWGADSPSFVHQMFTWVLSHPRVHLLMYYDGYASSGPLSLSLYPHSAASIGQELRKPMFPPYSTEWMQAA